jgi:hypothetical protein
MCREDEHQVYSDVLKDEWQGEVGSRFSGSMGSHRDSIHRTSQGGAAMLTQHWVEDTAGIHAEWVEEEGTVAVDLGDEGDDA